MYSHMRFWIFSVLTAFCLSPLPVFAQEALPYQLRRILGQYTEMYGGLRDAASLSSVIVEGKIAQDGENMRFMMHRKRPNLFRYRLSLNGNSVTSGYDGRIGWVREEMNRAVEIRRLEGAALASLEAMGRFESPLFQYDQKNDYSFKLLPQQYWEGRSVHVIEVTDFRGSVSQHFLDATRGHILRLDRLDASGAVTNQTLYRDYKTVEGFPFAYEVERRTAGETVSIAKIETISVNTGVLSFYFRQPSR